MDADKSTTPVFTSITSPALELNVPPDVPVIVGVGSDPSAQ